jgi:RHS repeat-associated protein
VKKLLIQAASFAVLSFSMQSTAFAAYTDESYGTTALSTKKVAVESCTPGIDAVSRQIETDGQDITGLLPFNRTYRSSLQLGFDASTRSADAQTLDEAFALTSIENKALFGAGWSHNYDYQLTSIGTSAYTLNTPGGGLPLVFAKQSDGSIKLSNSNLVAVSQDREYKITDSDKTITVNINGLVVTFTSLSGMRGLIQNFQATKIQYAGGRVVNMTYSTVTKSGSVIGYLMTGISDNIGNALKVNRFNMSGADTSTLGVQLQGSISSVETNSNSLNKQVATYSYVVTPVNYNGRTLNLPKLTQVVTTIRGTENYIYNDYNHIGLFSDANKKNRGVIIPLLSEYRHDNQTVMTWSASANSLTSGSPSLFSSYISYSEGINDAQLTINPPSATTSEVYTITNGYTNSPYINTPASINGSNARYVKYTTSSNTPCLNINGVPLKEFAMEKNSRTLAMFVDKNNNRTDLQYDTDNRLLEKTEAKGSSIQRKTTMTYTTGYAIPSTVKVASLTLTNSINGLGQVYSKSLSSTQTGSTTKTTAYTYFPSGLLNTVDGPRAGTIDTVTYTYDDYGNLAKESQVVGTLARDTQYLGYNSLAKPERIVYPTGLVDQFIYDTDGTLKQKNHGVGSTSGTISGQTTTYTYDSRKRVKTETNPDGEVTTFDYDVLGRLIKLINPDGSIKTTNYFPNGLMQSEQLFDASQTTLFHTNTQTLDANGRVDRVRSGNNENLYWVSNIYDNNGSLKSTLTAKGITESWTYDELNRIKTHTDGNGKVDTKTYDALDNIIIALDSVSSGSTPLDYINGGILSREVNRDFATKIYTYNEADQQISSLHDTRLCQRNSIDALGRPANLVCQNNGSSTANNLQQNDGYIYDTSRFGRLDKVLSNDTAYGVDTQYRFDDYDRIAGKTQTNRAITTLGGSQPNLALSYGYSTAGKLASITLPSNRVINYVYDTTKKGQLVSVNLSNTPIISSIGYNLGGQITSWNWGNTASQYLIGYDTSKNSAIKTITAKNAAGSNVYRLAYGFDSDGRITVINRNNGLNDTYGYDNVSRLTSEARKNGTADVFGITYTYDDNGNRKSLVATGTHQQPAANVIYNYTTNTNRLSSVLNDGVTSTPSYTTEGEMKFGSANAIYDYAGHRRFTAPTTSTAYYMMNYNHKNERTIRTTQNNSVNDLSTTTQYVYDEASRLLGEYTAAGVPIVEYIWIGERPIAAVYGLDTATKIYWIASDALNTPRRLFNSANHAVVWAWDSTTFGVAPPSVQTVKFNLRFSGQYFDELTNQHYNLNRYYNPQIGRYMEADPIGLEGGLNPYAYAGSNPVNNVDPTGLEVAGTFSGSIAAFTDIDSFMPNIETRNVSPSEYRFDMTMPYNQVMVFKNVFSGENRMEDFKSNFDYMTKPTPRGDYDILQNTFSSHKDWYRLDPKDSVPRNDKWEGSGIEQVRLHLGLISHACVTFDKRFNTSQDWGQLQRLFNETSKTTVPISSTLTNYGGLRQTEKTGTALRYGTFHVK